MTEGIDESNKVVQKESLKLARNSKGYTWEIKIFLENGDEESLKRIAELNQKMMESYGGSDDSY